MKTTSALRKRFHAGLVVPAHPLALTRERKFDERRQRALTRYYLASGAGGVAVGVHTTQFRIHDDGIGLYRPVLELAAETVAEFERSHESQIVKIAGVVGNTDQAVREALYAVEIGYDAALVSLASFAEAPDAELVEHCRILSEIIPVVGFYLQPAIGGRVLSHGFWRQWMEIENVVAVKVAPFNRYQTLDVVRALLESGREKEIALYTGNDDNIVGDLLGDYSYAGRSVHFSGGLLGQWAVWTKRAVELLERIKEVHHVNRPIPRELLRTGHAVTDCNAAIFDAKNSFAGCIPGIHEVLRRQGLLEGTWTLDPGETLSPGQREEIDRVYRAYPQLNDDVFVREHLEEWLKQ